MQTFKEQDSTKIKTACEYTERSAHQVAPPSRETREDVQFFRTPLAALVVVLILLEESGAVESALQLESVT
jgi:hypothetical protein